ncbi:UNVERIFIED_CONTAM: Secreted RxLR effector protein [Sesamum indicum]
MRNGVKLSKKQSPKTDEELRKMLDIPYASVVGNIQYIVQYIRPDVAFTLSITSRYQASAGYNNASFQCDEDDAKSQSGFVFRLNGGLVAWKSSKKDTTSDSTIKAEYIACSEATEQAEPRSHHRTKHIFRRYHLPREMVGRGDVRMDQLTSAENIADPLTKSVSQIAHGQHLGKMGLKIMSDWP